MTAMPKLATNGKRASKSTSSILNSQTTCTSANSGCLAMEISRAMGERIIWEGQDSSTTTETCVETYDGYLGKLTEQLPSLSIEMPPGDRDTCGSMHPGQMILLLPEMAYSHSLNQWVVTTKSPSRTLFTTESGSKSRTVASTKLFSRQSGQQDNT